MTEGLLDTSVLIAAATTSASSLPVSGAISVVSLGELHAGILLSRDNTTKALRTSRLDTIRRSFLPLTVDAVVAQRYGEILAFARSTKRIEKASDLLIVATAAAHGRVLYTRDERQSRLARAVGVEASLVT